MKKEDLKFFTRIPTIRTERLTLRQITLNDLQDVFEYGNDPAVSEYLLWKPHPDINFTKQYLNYIATLYKKAKFYDWGIEFEGKMIGTCGFSVFDLENNSAQIGYVLNSHYWNKGIAREAVAVLLRVGFEMLGLERIEARYMEENIGSERVAIKSGFSKEGVLRNAIYSKMTYRNIGICAITKEDYFTTK